MFLSSNLGQNSQTDKKPCNLYNKFIFIGSKVDITLKVMRDLLG